jgi:cell division septum initiation protein DivIVA
MNPVAITTIISAATFILTIFSALYLNQRHTDKLVEQLERRLDEQARRFEMKVEELGRRLETKMDAKFETVNARLEAIARRLSVESRLDRLEGVIFKPALP